MADPPNIESMTREQLNAHAPTVGVDNPESFGTKAELIAAIQTAQPNRDPGIDTTAGVTATHAGVNSPGQDSGVIETNGLLDQGTGAEDAQPKQRVGVYIVDGQTVDANGKPVKD